MMNLASLLPNPLSRVATTEPLAADVPSAGQSIESAVKDFESLFISMLLKEMRQTGEGDGLFGGEASDTYGGIFDLYFSQHLANAGGLGLAPLFKDIKKTPDQP